MTAAAARRFLPSDPKDFLRSAVPLALLALAAWEPSARWIVLALLVLGLVIAARRAAPVRWTWAATLPVAATLTIVELQPSFAASFPELSCAMPGNTVVSTAVVSAVVVVAVVIGLAVALRADRGSLFVRGPSRRYLAWVPIGLAAGLVAGYLVLPVLLAGTPVPALLTVTLGVDIISQAVLYGLATAIASEVAYRGALLAWSARVLGTGPSVLGQAIIAALVPVILGGTVVSALAVGAYALLIGVITVQVRSLAVGLATTAGLATALYLQLWCNG